MKKITTPFLVFLTVLIVSACVTQKKKGADQGPIKKLYHNTTAEFNGYFNADILVTESIAQLESQYQDNYNKVLPVYKYQAADNPQAVAEDLDEAIKKVSIVVNLHPYSNWTDDCYLIIGQSQFIKKDFESSQETFEYLIDEYNPRAMEKRKEMAKKASATKKAKSSSGKAKSKKAKQREAKKKKKAREKARKEQKKQIEKNRKLRKKGKATTPIKKADRTKKDEEKKDETIVENSEDESVPTTISLGSLEPETVDGKPENYFMKHRPAYQDAVLWLARAYIERENYSNAERLMDQLESSAATQKDIRAQLAAVQAHYYLKRKMPDRAMAPLEKAIELEKDKLKKARYSYIVGQLHQNENQAEQAYASFERVVKFGPEYEMTFSAKLAMAQNAWLTGKGTPEQAMKNLEKMLKDFKNIDFQDRIYFAMAQIALKQDHVPQAIVYFKKSAWYNIGNETQKAESYYQLATLYYQREDYVNSKNYYDSTLTVMTKADERYEPAEKLRNNLTDIAKNIEIITLQDSLLHIAQMTEEEKRQLVADLKAREAEEKLAKARLEALKEEQRKLAQKAGMNRTSTQSVSSSRTGAGGLQTGQNAQGRVSNFFAYDDRKIKRGERDFQRTWSARPLEDNWRRSNQQTFTPDGKIVEADEVVSTAITDEDVKAALSAVPKTEEEIEAANRKIEAAMFALGSLFRDRLQNHQKATEYLEGLIERYPDTQYKLDALYFLYLAYTDLGNTERANYYKNKIITEYPTSTYARVLKDPSFVKTLLSDEERLNNFYDETYAAFKIGNYKEASDKIGQVGERFGSMHSLQPRFALLSALCTGNLQGKAAYTEALKAVIAKYPGTQEETRAKEILRLLGEKQASGPGQNRPTDEDSKFKHEADKLHYVLVVFNGEVNLNDAKVAVSDYHRKYHKLDKLRVSNIYLGSLEDKVPIIVVRRYKDMNKAMDYYNGVQKNSGDYLTGFDYKIYPITQNNYRQVLRSKSMEGYDEFFELNYKN